MEIWEENQIPEMIQKSIQELIKRAEKNKKTACIPYVKFLDV